MIWDNSVLRTWWCKWQKGVTATCKDQDNDEHQISLYREVIFKWVLKTKWISLIDGREKHELGGSTKLWCIWDISGGSLWPVSYIGHGRT